MVERVEAPTRPQAVQRLVQGLGPAVQGLGLAVQGLDRVDSAALLLDRADSAALVRGRADSAAPGLPPSCSSARAYSTPARGSTLGTFDAGDGRQLWATET